MRNFLEKNWKRIVWVIIMIFFVYNVGYELGKFWFYLEESGIFDQK